MKHEDRTCLTIGIKMTEISKEEYEMVKYKTWAALMLAFEKTDPLRRMTEHIEGIFNDQ